jgi:hypothetical protein
MNSDLSNGYLDKQLSHNLDLGESIFLKIFDIPDADLAINWKGKF